MIGKHLWKYFIQLHLQAVWTKWGTGAKMLSQVCSILEDTIGCQDISRSGYKASSLEAATNFTWLWARIMSVYYPFKKNSESTYLWSILNLETVYGCEIASYGVFVLFIQAVHDNREGLPYLKDCISTSVWTVEVENNFKQLCNRLQCDYSFSAIKSLLISLLSIFYFVVHFSPFESDIRSEARPL